MSFYLVYDVLVLRAQYYDPSCCATQDQLLLLRIQTECVFIISYRLFCSVLINTDLGECGGQIPKGIIN